MLAALYRRKIYKTCDDVEVAEPKFVPGWLGAGVCMMGCGLCAISRQAGSSHLAIEITEVGMTQKTPPKVMCARQFISLVYIREWLGVLL